MDSLYLWINLTHEMTRDKQRSRNEMFYHFLSEIPTNYEEY